MSVFIHDPIVFLALYLNRQQIQYPRSIQLNHENFKQDLVLIEQFATL